MPELLLGTAAIDFSGVTLPFNVKDLLSSGTGLLGIVGAFVLLGLAFPLVGKLIQIIRRSFGQGGKAA